MTTHAHAHDHGASSADHHPSNLGRAFAIGVVLNTTFVVIEVVYGLMSNSLALLADAGHNLGDVLGLLVAWGATYLSQWQPTPKHSYGLRRSSVLAALVNAVILLVSIGGISWEAIRRFRAPETIQAGTVVWVAAVGIVINTATALLFLRGRKDDLNIRGAFLHMTADAAISAGVVIAGLLILRTGVPWIDPIVSLAIAAVIFVGTWGLLRESVNLALDAVPSHIDPEAVQAYLAGLPNVQEVHHLHVWGLSTTDAAMTVHLVLSQPELNNDLLSRIRRELHDRYRIEHATIQLEAYEDNVCVTRTCRIRSGRGSGG
jgi:cobalt-zinc-cadmium efflux system protein